jgi:CheY-like chemotaxis protein
LSYDARFSQRRVLSQAKIITWGKYPTVIPAMAGNYYPMHKKGHSRATASAIPQVHHRAKSPLRILMVEDDVSILQFSTSVLMSSGFQVDTAVDGEAGWDALHTSSYDLLITDNNMPKLSGVELVQKLRSAHMTLPVVMASGAIPTEALNRNPSLELAATLAKPFTMDELLGTVKKALHATEGPPAAPAIFR